MRPIIIAEIGCNHKGDMEIAKEMIKTAKEFCGVDAVKFQKRNILELLSEEGYYMPHSNPLYSFGKTYGEHREYLEFTIEEHTKLKRYCEEFGVIYSTSVWDLTSAKEIVTLKPEWIKIPSAMNTNLPLIEYLCDYYQGEIHISVGMTTKDEIQACMDLFTAKKRNQDVVLYSCTSGYSVPFEDVCLLEMKALTEQYGESVKAVGFSGHHRGTAVDLAAYVLGASYIQRQFTMNRTWKGSEQAASLEPVELWQLVQNIQGVEQALSYKKDEILPIELVQRDRQKYNGNIMEFLAGEE